MSRPLQVYLDETDLKNLTRWARERKWTKSQAVRAAIRALTREDDGEPLLRASGMIDGLPADLSARFDRYLEDTFIAEPSASLPGPAAPFRESCSSIAAPGSRCSAPAISTTPRPTGWCGRPSHRGCRS